MTRGERIRAAARTIRTPHNASWIAAETDVSVKTAQKYLDQLVEDNVLLKTLQVDQMLYCVDQLMATYREFARLQREYDRTKLTSALESMSTQITDWKASYDVETPGELWASIVDCEGPTEIENRHEVVS